MILKNCVPNQITKCILPLSKKQNDKVLQESSLSIYSTSVKRLLMTQNFVTYLLSQNLFDKNPISDSQDTQFPTEEAFNICLFFVKVVSYNTAHIKIGLTLIPPQQAALWYGQQRASAKYLGHTSEHLLLHGSNGPKSWDFQKYMGKQNKDPIKVTITLQPNLVGKYFQRVDGYSGEKAPNIEILSGNQTIYLLVHLTNIWGL